MGWQGGTTRQASASKEKQKRQRDTSRLNRVDSVGIYQVNCIVGTGLCIQGVLSAEASGQLPYQGSIAWCGASSLQ